MKTCTKCGVEKHFSEFHRRKDTDKYRSSCKKCTNSATLERYHCSDTVKESHRVASRKHILKKYGLTFESYMDMYNKQNGECAICNKPVAAVSENRYQTSCVDHCHDSGRVRGLLCWDCNVGLGKFFDKPDFLDKAAEYLRTHS